jgi:hypothetical protein
MGRPKGSKNAPQSVDAGSINLTGAQAPVTSAPKATGENTLGKVMRSVTITFAPGTLTARRSAGGYIACNGRGVDADGITWNVPTAMPLNPSNGKSCPVDGVDIGDFLGNIAG